MLIINIRESKPGSGRGDTRSRLEKYLSYIFTLLAQGARKKECSALLLPSALSGPNASLFPLTGPGAHDMLRRMSETPSGDNGYQGNPRVPRRGSTTIHLMARHREIIRLTIMGWTPIRIAASVGLTVSAIRAIFRAPLVQAELERLQDEADRLTVNVPLRAQVEGELRGATVQALRLNRRLMADPRVDARTRANTAKHFMDRVLFRYRHRHR